MTDRILDYIRTNKQNGELIGICLDQFGLALQQLVLVLDQYAAFRPLIVEKMQQHFPDFEERLNRFCPSNRMSSLSVLVHLLQNQARHTAMVRELVEKNKTPLFRSEIIVGLDDVVNYTVDVVDYFSKLFVE